MSTSKVEESESAAKLPALSDAVEGSSTIFTVPFPVHEERVTVLGSVPLPVTL